MTWDSARAALQEERDPLAWSHAAYSWCCSTDQWHEPTGTAACSRCHGYGWTTRQLRTATSRVQWLGESDRVRLTWNNTNSTFKLYTRIRLSPLQEREINVLFNDTLNTFYLRLYGIRHMVKDHSDGERGNPLPPHGLFFSINSKDSFICTIPQTGYHIPQPLLHQSRSTGWKEK